MPINKNAFIRYQTLDRCLGNHQRRFYFKDLLDAVNSSLAEANGQDSQIARTQLYKDLRFIESEEGFNAQIERIADGREKYFRYKNPDFSLNNAPVNEQEKAAIKEAITVLQRFKGLPQFDWLQEMLPGLEDRLHNEQDSTTKQIIYFDDNIDYVGRPFIEPLFHHIAQKNVLDISYQDFKAEEPYSLTLHPYILKQYNQRWFLFGKNEENGVETWNLALDRIKGLKVNRKSNYQTTTMDWEEDYFFDIIGVTRYDDVPLERIQLYCPPMAARYIETKPLHPTQRTISKETDGSILLEVCLYQNPEFKSKIRQFEGVKIVRTKNVHIE